MRAALATADRGVRASLVMLPRSVHGRGDRHGFVPRLIAAARATGVSGHVGDGASRGPAVHLRDAARLYRLAIEHAPVGAVLHAVGEEGCRCARSRPAQEFGGLLGHVLGTDLPAASTITRELLHWQPGHPGLIEDIEQGHYVTL